MRREPGWGARGSRGQRAPPPRRPRTAEPGAAPPGGSRARRRWRRGGREGSVPRPGPAATSGAGAWRGRIGRRPGAAGPGAGPGTGQRCLFLLGPCRGAPAAAGLQPRGSPRRGLGRAARGCGLGIAQPSPAPRGTRRSSGQRSLGKRAVARGELRCSRSRALACSHQTFAFRAAARSEVSRGRLGTVRLQNFGGTFVFKWAVLFWKVLARVIHVFP